MTPQAQAQSALLQQAVALSSLLQPAQVQSPSMELLHHFSISQQLPAAHYNSSHLELPTQAGQRLPIAIALQRQSLTECELAQQ
jgi:hypothetical protein